MGAAIFVSVLFSPIQTTKNSTPRTQCNKKALQNKLYCTLLDVNNGFKIALNVKFLEQSLGVNKSLCLENIDTHREQAMQLLEIRINRCTVAKGLNSDSSVLS